MIYCVQGLYVLGTNDRGIPGLGAVPPGRFPLRLWYTVSRVSMYWGQTIGVSLDLEPSLQAGSLYAYDILLSLIHISGRPDEPISPEMKRHRRYWEYFQSGRCRRTARRREAVSYTHLSIAQLVRAPALQAGGHRFESYCSHQLCLAKPFEIGSAHV